MAKKVMVLAGGVSTEREVSLVTGKGVAEALCGKGYEVSEHDFRDGKTLIRALSEEKPDAVFNALHGNWGEDGAVQGLLDVLQIPYTHSGMRASLLGMDKGLTRMIAYAAGVKTAEAEQKTFGDYKREGTKIALPYVVKPVADGSSVGVFIVQNSEDEAGVWYDDENREVLIEKFIEGKELTCAVFDGRALAVTELRPKEGFYDYRSKYTAGMTTHVLPAEIPSEAEKQIRYYAEQMHRALGCRMLSRSDFRYNEKDGAVFLEINTNPGMTPLSLVPEQAKFCGISYEDLCARLVENAACREMKREENEK